MPLIISLETATNVCSVALARDGKLVSLRELNAGYSHAENLTYLSMRCAKKPA
jgi:tRNA threonylcarbamoyladenosine biosynthesis protein TsaB